MTEYASITATVSGERIDKFLSGCDELKQRAISRQMVQNLLANGFVTLGSLTISKKHKTKASEQYLVTLKTLSVQRIKANKIDFTIVYEDEDLLVIDKPAGLTTHPGNGNHDNTLVNALLDYCPNELSHIGGEARPGIVHRLDKDTSGLILVAKNDFAHQHLAKQIQEKTAIRRYLAICSGRIVPASGVIDLYLRKSRRDHRLMEVFRNYNETLQTGVARRAITHYKTREIFGTAAASLVECQLMTGRTHQIRVHLDALGHPIIGDKSYGLQRATTKLRDISFPRQALHSYMVGFTHPRSRQDLSFEIEMPQDMIDLCEALFMI